MKLRYTPRALAELDDFLTYIAERSPQGALRIQTRVQAIAMLLLQHPRSGQRTTNPRLRRIAVTPYPCFLFYEITGDEIIIIGVRHAVRDPASMPGGKQA